MPQIDYPSAIDDFPVLTEQSIANQANLVNALNRLHEATEAIEQKAGVSTSGAPQQEVKATLSTDLAGDDNDLDYTAVGVGADGNDVTIAYVDPGENDAALAVTVSGTAITVSLATDSNGDITTTAADIVTEIEGTAAADALVTVANKAANDGSGVVIAMAATALEGGTDATSRGYAPPGAMLFDKTNGLQYWNTGTSDAPVWTQLQPMLFKATATLTSAAAATPVDLLTNAQIPTGWKVYVEGYIAKVDGATDWATVTSVSIRDKDASPVEFVALTASALDGNEVHGPWSDSASIKDAMSEQTGGTASKGLEVVGDQNGTGSDLKLTVWGRIAP